jgi:hypothetical protein
MVLVIACSFGWSEMDMGGYGEQLGHDIKHTLVVHYNLQRSFVTENLLKYLEDE